MDSKNTTYFSIPYALINSPEYSDMPVEAAVLYGLLRDRNKLSEKNKWTDEVGTFLYFTVNTACELLHCKKDKAMKLFRILELHGLINKRRDNKLGPNKYYVMDILTGEINCEPALSEKSTAEVGNGQDGNVG